VAISEVLEVTNFGVLRDCYWARDILSMQQPKSLLLLGSGETKAPDSWLTIPGLNTIRVNERTFGDEFYSRLPTYAIVTSGFCWADVKVSLVKYPQKNSVIFLMNKDEQRLARAFTWNEYPIFEFGTNCDAANDKLNLEKYGSWYYARVLKFRNIPSIDGQCQAEKYLTTGVYLTMWLLAGMSENIYIAGFDAWRQDGTSKGRFGHYKHSDGTKFREGPGLGHNLDTEWFIWDDAVRIARERGVNVHLSWEMK